MDVIATKKGFYNKVISKGEEFTLASRLKKGSKDAHQKDIEEQFSSEWMEQIKSQEQKVVRVKGRRNKG